MSDDSRRNQITVRVIRDGSPEPRDNDWSLASAEERIEAVWTLTELCLGGINLQPVNPDFKELLLAFNVHHVEYLIVGAHALAAHGHVRATKTWMFEFALTSQRIVAVATCVPIQRRALP